LLAPVGFEVQEVVNVLQLIEQIPEPQDRLIQALTDLANDFCFEELMALTQPLHSDRE
jgi:hypothetical protein